MATLYVSYKSEERPFVEAVMSRLEARHEVRIDYNLRPGADWPAQQLQDMRECDVCLVFISQGTRGSDFQNAEMGAARFCSRFVDDKLILPALIDDVEPPRPLAHLDVLDLRHRDPARAATELDAALDRRTPRVRLFISHAHQDGDLAARLTDVLTSSLEVPEGELRCTSVPGFKLDLGTMAAPQLRRELGSAAVVIALLTPDSLAKDWVLFELGAAWANARVAIPLLAGGLEDRDIPGPFRGAAGGQMNALPTLDHLIDQLEKTLGWRQRGGLNARNRRYEFVDYVKSRTYARDPLEEEAKASFAAKRARIGSTQGGLLDHVTQKLGGRPHIPQDELARHYGEPEASLYYRLEQLRLYGFLERVKVNESDGRPVYGWALAEKYRREIGL